MEDRGNNASEVRGHIRFHLRKSNHKNLKRETYIIYSDPAPSDGHDNVCGDLKKLGFKTQS